MPTAPAGGTAATVRKSVILPHDRYMSLINMEKDTSTSLSPLDSELHDVMIDGGVSDVDKLKRYAEILHKHVGMLKKVNTERDTGHGPGGDIDSGITSPDEHKTATPVEHKTASPVDHKTVTPVDHKTATTVPGAVTGQSAQPTHGHSDVTVTTGTGSSGTGVTDIGQLRSIHAATSMDEGIVEMKKVISDTKQRKHGSADIDREKKIILDKWIHF